MQESKLTQILPVFFIPKKDRTKRMVQDYCYLSGNAFFFTLILSYPILSYLIKDIHGYHNQPT